MAYEPEHAHLIDPETDPRATYVLEPDDIGSLVARIVTSPGAATFTTYAPFTGGPIAAVPLSTPDDVERARLAAVDVRDSNEDDRYLQPSAYYVVTLADKVLEDENRKFETTAGRQGIEKREKVKSVGEGDQAKVVREDLPPQIASAIRARDDVLGKGAVPPAEHLVAGREGRDTRAHGLDNPGVVHAGANRPRLA